MKRIYEIRLENMRKLIEEVGTVSELARLAGYRQPSYLYQIINQTAIQNGKPKNIGDKMARKLEEAVGKNRGWMDTIHQTINAQNVQLSNNYGSGNQSNTQYNMYQQGARDEPNDGVKEEQAQFLKAMPIMDMDIAARYLIGENEDREQIYDLSDRTETFIPKTSETIGVTVSDNSMLEFSADRIQAGDILLVEPKMPPRNNDLIFLCLDNTKYWRGLICRLKVEIDGSRMVNHDGSGFIPMPAGAVIGGVVVELKRRFVPTGLLKSRLDAKYDIMQSRQTPDRD